MLSLVSTVAGNTYVSRSQDNIGLNGGFLSKWSAIEYVLTVGSVADINGCCEEWSVRK